MTRPNLPDWTLAMVFILVGLTVYLATLPLTDLHSDEYLVYHQV